MTGSSKVAIIGAGPYGLSIAAHLRAHGIDFRIFGSPMHSWRTRMPAGMFLKSEGSLRTYKIQPGVSLWSVSAQKGGFDMRPKTFRCH